MKAIVIFLALLATAKIGYSEYLFRSSTNDVIINAYKNRAIKACRKDAKAQQLPSKAQIWSRPDSFSLVIGKSNLDVQFWQIDHSLWNARFRNPYLFLVASTRPSNVFCEYDIVHGSASVYRM